ncbi:MAG: hypothetical protein SO434_00730 [Eubacteriales bacterium]|nr:hypothetical protein [Eubacteriales bacterium]
MKADKNNVINVLLKIALAISLVFSAWWSVRSFSNIMPYMAEGQQLLSLVSPAYVTIMFSVVMPILTAMIIYAVYMFLERSVLRSLGRNMEFFGQEFDGSWHTRLFEVCAIVIALTSGIAEMLWTFYPLASGLGRPLVDICVKIIVLGAMYWLLYRKHGKEMMPFVYSATLFPTIFVVIFA